MRDHDISQRRACQLVGIDPKTVRRERPPDCPDIREEMKEIAGKRRRFGYRRIGILLERKGMLMNHKKLYRLYREEGLSVSPDLRGDLRERTSFESRSLRVGPPLRNLRRIGREPLRQANREGDWNNRIALCGFLGP